MVFYHQTLYTWQKKYSGVESSNELARLKELEQENSRLKRMYAEACMECDSIKDVFSKTS